MKRSIYRSLLVLCISLGVLGAFSASNSQTTLSVSNADLTAAGFTKITPISAWNNLFVPPNKYYQVDGGEYLTVLVRPMDDINFTYNGGAQQVVNLGASIQIRASQPGYYIVVTGSDQTKIAKLVSILQAKK